MTKNTFHIIRVHKHHLAALEHIPSRNIVHERFFVRSIGDKDPEIDQHNITWITHYEFVNMLAKTHVVADWAKVMEKYSSCARLFHNAEKYDFYMLAEEAEKHKMI